MGIHKDDKGMVINPPRYIVNFTTEEFEMSYFIFEDEIMYKIWGIGMGWES